jgi:hypothetical protein
MKRVLIALAVIACLVAFLFRRARPSPPGLGPSTGGSSQSKIVDRRSKVEPELANVAAELNSPDHGIAADLRIVSTMIDTYRSNFPHEGNPVGNNREITATLAGDNRLRLGLIPKNHPAINRNGELCDRWGTPFFFHAESGTQMEIRSAGPDRKLFTADDVLFGP